MQLDLFIPKQLSKQEDTILVALSGGADSVALLHALHAQGFKICAAHMNYQLRGIDSDEDEQFCYTLCQKLGIDLYTKKSEPIPKGENLQAFCRKNRYQFFEKICLDNDIKWIATAHHANDRFESLLMNISKGSSAFGYLGIPSENGKIIRPLIQNTRIHIEEYCALNQLSFRQDSSNASDKYTRNIIRHHITPVYENLHPKALQNFITSSKNLEQVLSYFHTQYQLFLKDNIEHTIHGETLLEKNLIDVFFSQWLSEKQFDADTIQIIKNYDGSSGEWHSNTGRLLKYRSAFHYKPNSINIDFDELQITESKIYVVNSAQITVEILPSKTIDTTEIHPYTFYANFDELDFPMTIRKVSQGDKMEVMGMKGQKKISDILTDAHKNRFEKESALVLVKNEEVLWLIGTRRSSKFEVNNTQSDVLKITFRYL